jgi:hypothetical protein
MAQAAQTEKNPKRLSRKPDANENRRRLEEARKRKKANLVQYPRSAPAPEVVVPDPHANLRLRMAIVLNSATKYSRYLRPNEVKMLGDLHNKSTLDHVDLQHIENILNYAGV